MTPLSDSSITTESVVIPGELKLSNPVPPSITVPLPLVTRPHGGRNVLFGFAALPGGALMLAFAVVGIVFGAPGMHLSLRDCMIFFVIVPFALFVGVSLTGAALTCFWDAIRNGPVLEIAAEGLRDYRSGLAVPWSSVRCARILYTRGGIGGVDLQLGDPVTNWQNPFRVGVLFHRYRPKPDHVIVSVACLDARPHVLAYTILTLIQWNGGEGISTSPGPNNMGLKLIPQGTPVNVRSSPAS